MIRGKGLIDFNRKNTKNTEQNWKLNTPASQSQRSAVSAETDE